MPIWFLGQLRVSAQHCLAERGHGCGLFCAALLSVPVFFLAAEEGASPVSVSFHCPGGVPGPVRDPESPCSALPGGTSVFVSLNWSTEGVRASGEVPSCSGQQRVAPVVMRVLAAPVGRGWPPGQGRVWIRKLFPTLEAEQRKPRAHAECNSGPGLWVLGGLGGLTSVLLKGSSGV